MAWIEDKGDRLIIWNGNEGRRGALSPELYDAINAAMDQARAPRIRAVILTSEGGFFCAGGDLNTLIERRKLSSPDRRARIELLHDLIRAIRACPVPVIAAVEGGAAGAGVSLALACDMVVAAEDAKFTVAYVKAGLVPDGGLTASLARALPRQMAMEMCLMGRPVAATRLAELGVVSACPEAGATFALAMEMADHIARGPRTAQGVIRQMVAAAYDGPEADQLSRERDAMVTAVAGHEAAEGIAAFLAKRKPNFETEHE
ncbi:MAG: enoyl-CoA hydratase family protein [Silicimonas sp.]|nr:enoyl-CoA hydratase family protein [Silicimonas sp.]